MHEVAKHVGVSPMTVSRVISGDANVRAETLQRVQQAIKELGYTPNVAARTLAKAATVHIGLLYNNPSAAYLNELLVGVLAKQRSGARLSSRSAVQKGERRSRGCFATASAASFAAPLSDSGRDGGTARAKIPFCGRNRPPGSGRTFGEDQRLEAAAAMTLFIVAGPSQYRFYRGRSDQTASLQRQAGFGAALRAAGAGALGMGKARIIQLSFRSGRGAEPQAPQRPTAILPATMIWRLPRSRRRTVCA